MESLVNKKLVTLCAFLDKLYEKEIVVSYSINRGFDDEKDRLDEGNLSVDFLFYRFSGIIGVEVYPDRYHVFDCRLYPQKELNGDYVTIKDLAKALKEELKGL